MPCRRPDEIVKGATVDLRRYFTTLLSSLARNRCPACREIRVQLRVKSLSSLPRNPCPAWCEIRNSDFAYLCRKLRERGAVVSVVGESKTPEALRNSSDQFFEWAPPTVSADGESTESSRELKADPPKAHAIKPRPKFVVEAVALLSNSVPDGQVHVSSLGQYLKRTDPGFSPGAYDYSGLLDMLKAYNLLALKREHGGHYTVSLMRPGARENGPEGEAPSVHVVA
ncbi:NYN domain-containing protein [Burkholderia sp. WP9]|uniref:OST-HTH/LOTUS domain-containing protein n=1 Tax=Burkholderia sp. WP9 TaxID=1500263 RepID=UPI00089BDB0F|nr:OST-HTH/LOTUS domain-containing protein [Burkholderia sp. WP9]SED73504.1 NYN domain-containing protein [Burkholderia sp. WP9]